MVTFLEVHIDMISYTDSSEEEKQEKNEKEVKEKDIISCRYKQANHSLSGLTTLENYFYFENGSTFISKILLPPPKTIG